MRRVCWLAFALCLVGALIAVSDGAVLAQSRVFLCQKTRIREAGKLYYNETCKRRLLVAMSVKAKKVSRCFGVFFVST